MYSLLLCTKSHVCINARKPSVHSGSLVFIAINQGRKKSLLGTLGMQSKCEGCIQHVVWSRYFPTFLLIGCNSVTPPPSPPPLSANLSIPQNSPEPFQLLSACIQLSICFMNVLCTPVCFGKTG